MIKIGSRHIFLFFLCFSSFFVNNTLYAQHNNFKNYSYEQGLSQSTLFCMTQDIRGYLWLGTDKGLVRFDGVNFKTFDKSNGFQASVVRSLLQDKKGRIWVGTQDDGLIIYDGTRYIKLDKQNGLAGSSVLCLLQDKEGVIWAGTDDGGLNKIRSVNDSLVIEVIDESKGLSNNSIMDMCLRQNGEIWLATFGGINIISPAESKMNIRQLRGGKAIPKDELTSIVEDDKGVIWCSTYNDGVFSVSQKDAQQAPVVLEHNSSNGFSAKGIWKITRTKNNDLWFASIEEGVVRYNTSKNRFIHYTTKDGLPGNHIFSAFEDDEDNIWLCTNGNGLCKFNGDVFAHYNERDGLPATSVAGIASDTLGNYWLVTTGSLTGGLVRLTLSDTGVSFKTYVDRSVLKTSSANCISIGKVKHNKNTWISLGPDGIAKYDGKKFTGYSEKDGLLGGFVYTVFVDQNGIVWCGTSEGISRYDGSKFLNINMEAMQFKEKGVYSIIQGKDGHLWFGTESGLAEYGGEGKITTYDEAEGLTHKEINALAEGPDGNIWIGTIRHGLYRLDRQSKEKRKIAFIAGDSVLKTGTIRSLIFRDAKTLLVGTDNGICALTLAKEKIIAIKYYDASNGFIGVEGNDNAVYKDAANNVWYGTLKGLTRFNPTAEAPDTNWPHTHITNVKLFFKEVNWRGTSDSAVAWFNLPKHPEFSYSDNHLTFEFTAISLKNPTRVRYKYMLEGVDKDWSPERSETSVTFSGLAPGTYTFKLIAAGENGLWNPEPATFSFTITPPWYRTKLFYAVSIILAIALIFSFIRYRERALVREKKVLEDKVTERTAEIVKQKEHIEEQKKEITDSINYARRIQGAVLAPAGEVKAALPGSFILFKPKDIVSGDFYWFFQNEHRTLIAAADCTGHGVPGAFMSMLGSEKLNEAVLQTTEPSLVLQRVNRLIRKVLRQSGQEGTTRDGMDVALLAFNKERTEVDYAGANRPLWITRANDSEIEEIKATKVAIGGFTGDEQEFVQHKISLKKGDTLYMFSDGYADQFGSGDKKFMTKRFKELLLSLQAKSMDEQEAMLNQTIENWRGNMEQTDDILVIGVRV